jgi:signal transduction histidine kinase
MRGSIARWADPLLAVAALAVVATAIVIEDGPPDRPVLVAIGLCVALCAPLALRRRAPLAVLGVCLVAAAAHQGLGYPPEPAMLPVLVALYTVAGTRALPRVAGLVGAVLVAVVALIGWRARSSPQELLGAVSWIALAVALGEGTRARESYLAAAAERAERAEAARAAETRRRISEERLRIAWDLHDLLSHSISLINVQASVATHVARTGGAARDDLVAALATIAEESRTSMAELRAVLGVLRTSDGAEDERSPAPGLDRLDELVAGAAARGVEVAVSTTGRARALPPAVDVTAYRVVQEALTNVARHAPGSRARLEIGYGDEVVSVEVFDDGPGSTDAGAPGTGHGLRGMAERVAAVGGRVDTGPRPGGGFMVCAELPTEGR